MPAMVSQQTVQIIEQSSLLPCVHTTFFGSRNIIVPGRQNCFPPSWPPVDFCSRHICVLKGAGLIKSPVTSKASRRTCPRFAMSCGCSRPGSSPRPPPLLAPPPPPPRPLPRPPRRMGRTARGGRRRPSEAEAKRTFHRPHLAAIGSDTHVSAR